MYAFYDSVFSESWTSKVYSKFDVSKIERNRCGRGKSGGAGGRAPCRVGGLGGGREPSHQEGSRGTPWWRSRGQRPLVRGSGGRSHPGITENSATQKVAASARKYTQKLKDDHFLLNPLISNFEYLSAEPKKRNRKMHTRALKKSS